MNFDWKVYNYDYHQRIGNLTSEAQGKVKSEKHFPIFSDNGKEMVFKPLSKTKPLSTPFFAYSEVFWSTIFHNYFDSTTPVYHLATCQNIEEEYPNKYHHGTVVEKLGTEKKSLINLYQLCQRNPTTLPDISTYINYCEVFYDYTQILDSEFMKEHPCLAESMAKQILCSILRQDQNYHYENVLFYQGEGSLEVAPMIDHEFSTMFMYLDEPERNKNLFAITQESLEGVSEETRKQAKDDILKMLYIEKLEIEGKNIAKIMSLYPKAAIEFLENLKCFITDFSTTPLQMKDYDYLVPFNTSNFYVGQARWKENDERKAKALEVVLDQYFITPDMVNDQIQGQVLQNAKVLKKRIEEKV